MIHPIVLYGDPVLRKKTTPVEKDTDISVLVQDMFETMYSAGGVGLAAPQIGIDKRIFVIDSTPMEEEGSTGVKMTFVNARMIKRNGEPLAFEEGCLSIPGIRDDVVREPTVTLTYVDENWNEQTSSFEGIVARIIQHEYDHIEGVLFIDYLTPFKKRLLKGKLAGISKGKVEIDYRVRVPARSR